MFISEVFFAISHFNPLLSDSYRLLDVANVLTVLVYPCLVFAMYYETKAGNIKLILKELHFSIKFIFAAALLAIIYFDLLLPYIGQTRTAFDILTLLYGIGDVVAFILLFAALLIVREYRKGKIFSSWLYIMASLIFMIAGDVILALYGQGNRNLAETRIFISNAWILGYLLIGYGAMKLGCIIQGKQEEIKMMEDKKTSYEK
jgi:hypothetical protein